MPLSSPSLPRPAKRVRDYLRLLRLMVGETRNQVYATRAALEARMTDLEALARDQTAMISGISVRVGELVAHGEASASSRAAEHAQLLEILRFVHDGARRRRERLVELRADPDYELPYSEADPLVSIVIPTYDNYELLCERAIPSALAQTHENLEIVVIGDAAPNEARVAVESFNDPRIRFSNLDYRGPYPADPQVRWLVAGVPPYNEAVRLAQGLWIAPLDDDDAFRPHHITRLLSHVRSKRLELGYGRLCQHAPDGGKTTIGRFPPELAQFGVQSTLYHAGLSNVFELELVDAPLGLPYDWGLCLRLMEAGVRMGMVDEETVDYYPSRLWTPRWPAEDDSAASNGYAGQAEGVNESEQVEPSRDLPEWEFVAEGWDRARRADDPSSVGWNAEDVARAYREKWPRFLGAVEGSGPLGVGHEVPSGASIDRNDVLHQNAIIAYAYAIARATAGSGTLSVLDWGGALGHYYVLARRLFPDIELDYHCRELPAVCTEGRSVLPEVSFHGTDECLNRSYDLVLASSSLQYEEAWQARLGQLAEACGGWLFLTRAPIARDHASFVVLQRAHAYGYGTEYLGWVFNRNELLAAGRAAGLALEREFALLPPFPIAGAPDELAHAGFLFRSRPGGQ